MNTVNASGRATREVKALRLRLAHAAREQRDEQAEAVGPAAGQAKICSTTIMGWETRRGREYYYRKVRIGNHVRSVYVGGGELARFRALLDRMEAAEDRQERKRATRALAREHAQMLEIDRAVEAVGAMVESAARVALLVAGCHLHNRQWRRRREKEDDARGRC